MLRLFLRRSLWFLTMLWLVLILSFTLFQVIPFSSTFCGSTFTGCAQTYYGRIRLPDYCYQTGSAALPECHPTWAQTVAAWGFDQPLLPSVAGATVLPGRFLIFCYNMLTAQFGSNKGNVIGGPIRDTIVGSLPSTVLLIGAAVFTSLGISNALRKVSRKANRLGSFAFAGSIILNSFPVYFVGGVVMMGASMIAGPKDDSLWSFIVMGAQSPANYLVFLEAFLIPFMILTLFCISSLHLARRNSKTTGWSESLQSDEPSTSKGSRPTMFDRLLGSASYIGQWFCLVIALDIVVEFLSGWPGLGRALVYGVLSTDFPLEQALFFIVSITTLVALSLTESAKELAELRKPIRVYESGAYLN